MSDYWTRSFEGLILYNIGSSCVVQVKETEAQRVEVAEQSHVGPKESKPGVEAKVLWD